MNIIRIVGYIAVAAIAIAVAIILKDGLLTIAIAICGFYIISDATDYNWNP